VAWTDDYRFDDQMEDVRDDPIVEVLEAELEREVALGHPLSGRSWQVVARALPQDEVLVACGDDVAMVHLTWSRRPESPPWPMTTFLTSVEAFESYIEYRY
jgi:hypothetical protein